MTIRSAAKRLLILAGAVASMLVTQAAPMAAEPDTGDFRPCPAVCTQQYAPVCGEKSGVTKTYSNACFAAADGAKVIAQGPCR